MAVRDLRLQASSRIVVDSLTVLGCIGRGVVSVCRLATSPTRILVREYRQRRSCAMMPVEVSEFYGRAWDEISGRREGPTGLVGRESLGEHGRE